LAPNESHLNTPLGQRANENPLVCASYVIGVSIPINNFLKVNTGLSFAQNGEAYNWNSSENDSSFLYSSTYRYIALPISLGSSYGKKIKFRLSAGLVPGIFSGYKQKQEWTDANGSEYDEEITIQDDLNFFKLSAQASVGIEYFFGKISIRAAYLYVQQLNNSYKEFEDYIHRENAQGGQLTLTYFLK
jgi:predicted porin